MVEESVLDKAREFHVGTRQWILDTISAWHKQNESRIFVLLGLAGVGKSVLLAHISAEQILPVIAVHFFSHDDNDKNSLKGCLLSLSVQLGTFFKFGALSPADDKDDIDYFQMFKRDIVEPLQRFKNEHNRRYVVVVDALDECRSINDERKKFLNLILSCWNLVSDWLSIIISSRPEDYIPKLTSKLRPFVLDTESIENNQDINLYFRERLGNIRLTNLSLNAAVKILEEKSQGLFLYARFLEDMIQNCLVLNGNPQLQAEEQQSLSMDMLKDDSLFPTGLLGVYNIYFKRLMRRLGGKTNFRRILAPIVSSREPIDISTWKEIVFKASSESESILEERTSNLLLVKHPKVRFLHKSMVDFLTDKNLTDYSNDANDNLYIDSKYGDRLLSKWMLTNQDCIFSKRHLVYHTLRIGQPNEVKKVIFNLGWLMSIETDKLTLIAEDVFMLSDDPDLKSIVNVLRLSSFAFNFDPKELPNQILGRLSPKDNVYIQKLFNEIEMWQNTQQGLKLLAGSPDPSNGVDSPLIKVLGVFSNEITGMQLANDDKEVFVSVKDEQSLFHLDLKESNSLGEIPGITNGCFAVNSNKRVFAFGSTTCDLILQEFEGSDSIESKKQDLRSIKPTLLLFLDNGSLFGTYGKNTFLLNIDNNLEPSFCTNIAAEGSAQHSGEITCLAASPSFSSFLNYNGNRKSFDYCNSKFRCEEVDTLLGLDIFEASSQPRFVHSENALIATGSRDKLVILWKIDNNDNTYSPVEVLRGHHEKWIMSICFTPDNSSLLSADLEYICHWSLESFTLLKKFRVARGYLSSISIHPDPKLYLLATTGPSNSIDFWSIRPNKYSGNNTILNSIVTHKRQITQIQFSKRGDVLISCSKDYTLLLWDVTTVFKNIFSFAKFSIGIPRNNYLETFDNDWAKKQAELSLQRNNINDEIEDEDDRNAVAPQAPEDIFVPHEVQNQKFSGQEQDFLVTDVSFSSKGEVAILVAFYGRVRIVDMTTGHVMFDFQPHKRWIEATRCFQTLKQIDVNAYSVLTAGSMTDNNLNVFELQLGSSKLIWQKKVVHPAGIADVSVRNGKVATACGDRIIRVFNAESDYEVLHELRCHRAVKSLSFDYSAEFLVSGSGFVQLWGIGEEVKDIASSFTHSGHSIEALCFGYGRRDLVGSSSGHNLQVHELKQTEKIVRKAKKLVMSLDLVIDIDLSKEFTSEGREVRYCYFSQDNKIIYAVIKFGGIVAVDIDGRQIMRGFRIENDGGFLQLYKGVHVLTHGVGFTCESPIRWSLVGPATYDGNKPVVVIEGRKAHFLLLTG